jgi:8-oxo-dGTP pyrophosphatase MutT (NUDIX family)
MIWKPNVTVAAIVEQAGQYLLVEEEPATNSGVLLNQPAGHLDAGESIIQAVIRETLEETAYHFVPEYIVGIYQWHSNSNDTTYVRFAFCGQVTHYDPTRTLDAGIIRAAWFDLAKINELASQHRSPLVMQCIKDHMAGKHYPLELITHTN